jgi:PPOX class probable F420-dependent enzyme
MATTAPTLTPEMRALFEGKNFASLATVCPDGHPQVSPIWIDIDGDEILVNTAAGRVKDRNMRREPRVAVSVYEQSNPYRMVTVQGRIADVTTDGAEDHIDKLSLKYTGKPYPRHGDRVLFRIRPERVASWGL